MTKYSPLPLPIKCSNFKRQDTSYLSTGPNLVRSNFTSCKTGNLIMHHPAHIVYCTDFGEAVHQQPPDRWAWLTLLWIGYYQKLLKASTTWWWRWHHKQLNEHLLQNLSSKSITNCIWGGDDNLFNITFLMPAADRQASIVNNRKLFVPMPSHQY